LPVAASTARRRPALLAAAFVGLALVIAPLGAAAAKPTSGPINSFVRAATFDVVGEVAEIVTATTDGQTLIYTDSDIDEIGFVDISDPTAPVAAGTLVVQGSPTSVTVTPDGAWALVATDTSVNFANPTGSLLVVDLTTRTVERTIPLGGQPDSIAVSPDGRFAAIAIENQRNEGLNGGALPQLPAGNLTIVDLLGAPSEWTTRVVALTGLASAFEPTDPEPEFVDINAANIAAVTLQENNAVALVDLTTGAVVDDWSTGVSTHLADLTDNRSISLTVPLTEEREPDAIGWTPDGNLATANEGDLRGGSRDWTIFSPAGDIVYTSGSAMEIEAVRHSHYSDGRSDNKGVEPEGLEIGVYGNRQFAFVGAERGNFVAVYRLTDETAPTFTQLLPTGSRPEGLLALPARGLLVTANEDDGTISIFQGRNQAASTPGAYPDVIADADGPVWAALSGLAAGPDLPLVAVHDTILRPTRILTLELGSRTNVVDELPVTKAGLPVAYDPEGIVHRPGGGYWLASEGPSPAINRNVLVHVAPDGSVVQEVRLPASLEAFGTTSGFEGVATSADGSQVYVAIQREWADDAAGFVKIGRYTPATGVWAFYRYPLETPPAVSRAWVGLSELVRVDDTTFAVIERDNQSGPTARVKHLSTFSIAGLTPVAHGAGTPPLVTKTLVRDLIAEDGVRLEKFEGMAILDNGRVIVSTDNDGFGETRLYRFGRLFD